MEVNRATCKTSGSIIGRIGKGFPSPAAAARRASLMSGNKANVAGDTRTITHKHTGTRIKQFAHYNCWHTPPHISYIPLYIHICMYIYRGGCVCACLSLVAFRMEPEILLWFHFIFCYLLVLWLPVPAFPLALRPASRHQANNKTFIYFGIFVNWPKANKQRRTNRPTEIIILPRKRGVLCLGGGANMPVQWSVAYLS